MGRGTNWEAKELRAVSSALSVPLGSDGRNGIEDTQSRGPKGVTQERPILGEQALPAVRLPPGTDPVGVLDLGDSQTAEARSTNKRTASYREM
jgi:hypothetical protein